MLIIELLIDGYRGREFLFTRDSLEEDAQIATLPDYLYTGNGFAFYYHPDGPNSTNPKGIVASYGVPLGTKKDIRIIREIHIAGVG